MLSGIVMKGGWQKGAKNKQRSSLDELLDDLKRDDWLEMQDIYDLYAVEIPGALLKFKVFKVWISSQDMRLTETYSSIGV